MSFHRDAELWFNDGNLVVRAESVMLRVYGSLLAAESSTLANLSRHAQPMDAELIDGCPAIYLYDNYLRYDVTLCREAASSTTERFLADFNSIRFPCEQILTQLLG
jgi:hypothetical protein